MWVQIETTVKNMSENDPVVLEITSEINELNALIEEKIKKGEDVKALERRYYDLRHRRRVIGTVRAARGLERRRRSR
jgi:hypothetical protein